MARVRCIAHSAWHSAGRMNFDDVAEVTDEDAVAMIENGLVMEVTDRQLEIEARASEKGKPVKRKDPSHAN